MKFAACLAMVFVLFFVPARAEDGTKASQMPDQQSIEVATSLICDTVNQVERFIALFDGNTEATLESVNREANSPNACVIATAAYVTGEERARATTANGAAMFKVMQILVLGVFTANGFQPVQPAEFFSLAPIDASLLLEGHEI